MLIRDTLVHSSSDDDFVDYPPESSKRRGKRQGKRLGKVAVDLNNKVADNDFVDPPPQTSKMKVKAANDLEKEVVENIHDKRHS